MIFRPFFDFEHGCAAYLFGCGGLGMCAVVDGRESEIEEYVASKPSPTIGFERRFNQALSLERDAFVDAITVAGAKPADFEAIVAFNRGHVAG